MTYEELVQAIQDYLETSETTFVSSIPLFVKSVENRVYNSVKLPALRKNVIGNFTAGNRYLTVPTDFLSMFSLAAIDPTTERYNYLLLKDANLIREVYPSPSAVGVPKVFGTMDSTTMILGPTPDKDYGAELHYFYYPETLVTAGTTWLSENFYSVILYGAIAEGYRFLKGDKDQQVVYDDQYQNALSLLREYAEGRRRSDAYSNKNAKPPTVVGE